MALSLEELSSILGATGQAATQAGGPWTWDRIQQRIREVAAQQRVPLDLAHAVIKQESNWDPHAVGDGGRAKGFFQLHAGAAKDAGIDPAQRHDIGQNIFGGIRYLRLKLDQAGGHIDKALRLYNGGGDPNYVVHVRRWLKPGVAEAAERPQGQGRRTTPAVPLTLDALEQLLGTPATPAQEGGQQPAPTTPQPPTASSTLEQDRAYRDWAAQQSPQDTPQATTTPQGGVPLTRQPASPVVDPRATQAGARPTEPSDLVIDIEKSSTPQAPTPAVNPLASLAMGQGPSAQPATPQPVTDPAARLATAGSTQQALNMQDLPWWAKAGVATGIGALGAGGGVAVGALGGPLAPVTVPLGEMAGSWLARKLNVELGLEEPGIVGDVAAVALPPFLRGTGALWRSALRKGAIPGTGAARHEMAQEAVEGLARKEVTGQGSQVVSGRLMPDTAADDLWTLVKQGGSPDIATVHTWREAHDVLRSMRAAPRTTANAPGRQAAEDFFALARRYGGPVPLQELDDLRRAIGPLAGRDPNVARIYGAILDDMESAAARGVSGADTLRQAIATTRKEKALDKLADLWIPGRGIEQTAGETTRVHGKRIQTQFETLMRQKLFKGAWSPEELQDIRATLTQVAKLTSVSLASGGTLTRQLSRHGVAGAAGVLGWAQGGPEQGAAYAMTVEAFPYVMSYLLSTSAGRAAIRNAIDRGGGRLGPEALGALLTAAREVGQGSGVIPTEARPASPGASGVRP